MSKTFKAFNSTFIGACTEQAASLHEVAQNAAAALEASGGVDEKAKATKQRAECHELKATQLASLSEGAVKMAHELGLDVTVILAQSREFKKRLMAALEAIATGAKVKGDNPLDAVLTYLAAKNTVDLSYSVIQKESRHETTTQAGYLRKFFKVLGVVASEDASTGKNVRFSLNGEAPFVSKLVAIYKGAGVTVSS